MLVAIPAALLMAWMGVEIGLASRSLNQARMAADAVALAAAARHADGFAVANQDALAAAQACRGPNGPVSISVVDAPGGGGDVEFGRWDETSRTFTPDEDGGTAVRATVRFAADSPNGAPSLILWSIFQNGSVSFTQRSVAVYNPPKHITSMLVLSEVGGAIDLDGSSTLAARGGVSVASSDGLAVTGHGSMRQGASLAIPILRVAGSVDELIRGSGVGAIEEGSEIPADPMAAVSLPQIDAGAGGDVTSTTAGTTRVAPGAHERLVATAGTVVLEAGVHQFTLGVSLSGSASLVLENAALELAPSATLAIGGSAALSGTGLQSGDWEGAWVMQRGAATTWAFGDAATIDVTGGAYGPGAAVTVSGDAAVSMQAAVIGSLRLADDAVLRLRDRIDPLDMPVVPGRARLVR